MDTRDVTGRAAEAPSSEPVDLTLVDFNVGSLPALDPALGSDPVSESGDGNHPGFTAWMRGRGIGLVDAQIHAERMARWAQRPKILLVSIVGADTLALAERTLKSLERQLYREWVTVFISDMEMPSPLFAASESLGWLRVDSLQDEAALVSHINALPAALGADWFAVLPAGFELEENALLLLGDYAGLHPGWVAIYSDDCASDGLGNYSHPRFKPDFDIDHYRAYDFVTPALWLRADAFGALGGFLELGDAMAYEFLLRLWEGVGDPGIGHIAEPFLHRAAELVASDRDCDVHDAVVLAHLERLQPGATVERGIRPGLRRVRWPLIEEPSVAIVVPTRDKLEFLAPCVESLIEKTAYGNYEVLIVNNQSSDPDTLAWFGEALNRFGGKVRILEWDAPFNFSAVNNFAADSTDADFLCLLNNDTEVIHPEWLSRMVELGRRDDVGAVGCRLMYPESGKVQHIGVVAGMGGPGVAEHPFIGHFGLEDEGPLKMAQVVRNVSAVTAACMLVRRDDYLQLGGMDEQNLEVLYNDVDLCFKIREAGKRVLWTPYATLVHHGNVSLSGQQDLWKLAAAQDRAERERAFMIRRWPRQIGRDPFFNRNLSLVGRKYECAEDYGVPWDPEFSDRPRVLALPLPGGSGRYRYIDPLAAVSDKALAQTACVSFPSGVARLPTLAELLRLAPDTLAVHGVLDDVAVRVLKDCATFFPEIWRVFALDDLVTQIPSKSSVYRHFVGRFRDARPRLRTVLKHCDRLVVSSQPLAELCLDMIDDIVVVPNRLSSVWNGHTSRRNRGARPRVGWVGAQQHQGDLELIEEVVETLASEVDFVFMGMATDQIRPHLAEFHEAVPWEEYPAKVASLDLDIALAPLELVPFNEAKSNLRLLEYGVFGWPVVCTDIYPYRHDDAPVTRVPNEPDAWIEAIRALARDPERRAAEGDVLQAWVRRGYMLDDHLEDWVHALLR